jgi:two-component system, OmpR family, phosphate regulon sensor histidine kinase PhoR
MDLNSLILLITGAALGCFAAYFLLPLLASREKSAPIRLSADSGMIPEQGVAQASPVPSVLIDVKGVIISANASALKAFGQMDAGTALSMKFRAPEMRAAVNAALSSGADTSFDMAERLPVERWHRVDICHMRLSDGENFLALFFRDQSEARKLDRMRSDFVANASHELRTPLASMTGFIETLKGPARNDEAAREKFLGIMQQQAERMARLIDDLLSLSRLEMRPVLAAGQIVDLQLTVEHVLDALRPMSFELGVVIERDIGTGRFMVAGARDELIQVIENLVENACKYGQQGKKVIVSLSATETEVRLSVRDFGPGIAAEHLPRLTERFYRVDAGASRAQKGTGLGLAIVKHILNRHHARLTVTSEIGGGSDFAATFPAPDHVDK